MTAGLPGKRQLEDSTQSTLRSKLVAHRQSGASLSRSKGEAKSAGGLRLKDLVDRVTETSGVKKKDVKTVVEAALAQIGAALKNGDSLNLVGLGRMRVAKAATEAGGAMTLKLRMGTPGEKAEKPGAGPLADAEDQD